MPSNVASNFFNIGQDLSVVLRGTDGSNYSSEDLGHMTSFNASQDSVETSVHPIGSNGQPLFMTIPRGYTGSIGFARYNNGLTALLAKLDNGWYDNGTRVLFDVQCKVRNRDNTVDIYTFWGCALSKGDLGKFEADKEVGQTVAFRAQTLTITGGPSKTSV